jgi:hypothetical protein
LRKAHQTAAPVQQLKQVAGMPVSGVSRALDLAGLGSSTIAAVDEMSDEELAQVAMRMMAVGGGGDMVLLGSNKYSAAEAPV